MWGREGHVHEKRLFRTLLLMGARVRERFARKSRQHRVVLKIWRLVAAPPEGTLNVCPAAPLAPISGRRVGGSRDTSVVSDVEVRRLIERGRDPEVVVESVVYRAAAERLRAVVVGAALKTQVPLAHPVRAVSAVSERRSKGRIEKTIAFFRAVSGSDREPIAATKTARFRAGPRPGRPGESVNRPSRRCRPSRRH